ncbi:MAG TPA: DUF3105 domain-containing protein [Actinomycetota bacterium]|nr:DUF3105 domain-containing protein [Actinomycetota bacterium]
MAKKKSKRKKRPQQRPPGFDPNEKRRQRLEEKRLQREAAAKAQRRAEFRERLVRGMVFAAVVVAAIWFFFLRTQTPGEIDGNEVREFREARGHTNEPVNYPMTPPVTGDHSQSAAPCGIHGTQIADELYVHSLEHGTVGVLYDPQKVEVETIRDIEALVGEYDDRTIAAPYPGTETPISVTSWNKMMRLDEFEEDTVTEYIDAFRGRGPENLPCENTQDAPFDPQSLEPAPAPTPSPDDGEGGGNRNRDRNNDDENGNNAQGDADNEGNGNDDSNDS